MNRKLRIIWIDDNPERADGAQTLAQAIKAKVTFKDVQDKDLTDVLENLVTKEQPDLVIIDHNLEDTTSGVFRKGSTAAVLLRNNWPECPIICISGVDYSEITAQQKMQYDDFISIQDISQHYNEIVSIAKSFKAIKTSKPENVDKLLDLLGVPEIDREKLCQVIPTQIKENFEDPGLAVEIAKWVNSVLLLRPGFLYDELRAATFIGLNIDGYRTIKKKFKSALYTGLFNTTEREMWWKSELQAILSQLTNAPGLPWEKGRKIKGINENQFSRCYSSNEPFPETVAFIDQTRNAREEPMKIKYTTIHPDFESMLYFDDIRLMSPAE